MNLPTTARYGLRLLVDVSAFSSPVSLSSCAGRLGISLSYLRQLAALLIKAGFLLSRKGTSGGVLLARPPKDISLLDVVSVLDDELVATKPDTRLDNPYGRCVRLFLLDAVDASVKKKLSGLTLADLVERQPSFYVI
jgi:Rrf2 family iron-sulfur cluster assembly transcriptional regulator